MTAAKETAGTKSALRKKVLPSRKSSSRNAGYSTKIKPVKVWLNRHTSRMRRGCPRKMPVIFFIGFSGHETSDPATASSAPMKMQKSEMLKTIARSHFGPKFR